MTFQELQAKLMRGLRAALAAAVPAVGAGLRMLAAFWRIVWPWLRRGVRAVGTVLIALVLVFEEWGWRPLAELLSLLARFRLWARLEGWVASLPPYGALAVFLLPSGLLLPLKLLALMLLAQGKALVAGALIVGAKITGTALVARIFMLTKPALMRIGWFARLYAVFMPWKEALLARVRQSWAWRYGRVVKSILKREVRSAWARAKPRLALAIARLKPRVRASWKRIKAELAALTGRRSEGF